MPEGEGALLDGVVKERAVNLNDVLVTGVLTFEVNAVDEVVDCTIGGNQSDTELFSVGTEDGQLVVTGVVGLVVGIGGLL